MRRKFKVMVNGKEYIVEIEEMGASQESVTTQPVQPAQVSKVEVPNVPEIPKKETPVKGTGGGVSAPMPGKILDVKVRNGDRVRAGDVLLILEAMKMENEIVAPKDGVVKEILVNPGDNVERGTPLVIIG